MYAPDSLWDVARTLLAILGVILLYAGFSTGLFERFADAATAEVPHPKTRRERKKWPKPDFDKQKTAFGLLVGGLALLGLLDWFVLPPWCQLPKDWLAPALATAFEAGVLIILFGSAVWFGRVNWSKWTFWVSLVTTLWLFLWISHLLGARDPGSLLILFVFSGLQFLWLFGVLGRIDRNKAEVHQTQTIGNSPDHK